LPTRGFFSRICPNPGACPAYRLVPSSRSPALPLLPMSNPSSTPVHDDLTPPVLQVRDLSVSFKTEQGRVQVVKNLNLDVYAGQTLAVVGESGSGKSVTSLALMRLVETGGGQIDSGSMLLRGRHAGT